ncbi:MAG: TonB-dependent receptor [Gemmatimonadaceae bacterium]
MSSPTSARVARPSRRARATARLTILTTSVLCSFGGPAPSWAQSADTTRAASDTARRIERVLVSAIRASDAAPIAQTTITRRTITQRQFGQDVPLLLLGTSPSLTAHTETGTNWGYSYLRLRGIDQTRINITIDGIPLNDMEDQVLYFANFADLVSSVQSVQVQRGVGTSSAGTASFAGSINFETMPVAVQGAGGDAQMQLGSYGAQRFSTSFHSGLTNSRFAVYGRGGVLRTNGFRDHSGVRGGSAFVGAGWFGDRDIVKLTALFGVLADTLSYVGATVDELQQNRRFNPLSAEELDRFGQQMVGVSYTRLASEKTSISTTLYRNSASGHYDYIAGTDRYQFGLAHAWYGVTSALTQQRGPVQLHAGVNANTYERGHSAFLRPDPAPLYANTGHKEDVSGFVKASYDAGRARWFADLQARHARFEYEPDAGAGITERSVDWTFLNPKAGVTLRIAEGISAFASYGATTREPARSDLFAGDDDMNAGNVDAIGDLGRVRPESVRDLELGVRLVRAAFDLQANLYRMAFRNDIARIGAPTASGSVLRRNVGSSYRRGLELEGAWRGIPRWVLGGNLAWSTNRIRQFTDSSGSAPVTLRNVEPVLTPRFIATHRTEVAASSKLTLSVEGHYQSRAFLDNTSNAQRSLPAFHLVDATARYAVSRYALTIRSVNLGDSRRFGSGSVSSGEVRYFILPARSVFVTGEVRW